MRALPAFALLVLCGCQSTYDGPRPVQYVVNTLFASRCNWQTGKAGRQPLYKEPNAPSQTQDAAEIPVEPVR